MSTPQKFTGTAYNGPTLIAQGRDPRTGPTFTYQYRGRLAELSALEAAQFALGRKTDLSLPEDGQGACVLNVTTGVDNSSTQDPDAPLVDSWSLDRNLVEKDVWTENKIATVLRVALPPGGTLEDEDTTRKAIARLKRDIDLYVRGEEKTEDEEGTQIDLVPSVILTHLQTLGIANYNTTVTAFIDARLRGFDADPQFSWVLKRTTVIWRGASTALRPNKDNVGRMFTGPSLQASEGLTDFEIIGLMPKGFWLKVPAKIDRSAPDKWTIEQEFWHAETYEYYKYGKAI